MTSNFRSEKIGGLLAQAKYAPREKRIEQVNACETLTHLLRPGKSYPYEFLCFHITGYRPRGREDDCLFSTEDLYYDLTLYAELLSKTVGFSQKEFDQKVYRLEEVCDRFKVTAKTVGRWRRSGLVARYMRFDSERLALGFLESSIQSFAGRNADRVRQGKDFSQLSQSQRGEIEQRLGRWAQRCPSQRQVAIEKTARRYGRAVETIRLILKELESAGDVQFEMRAPRIGMEEQERIFAAYESGASAVQLSKDFGRSRSNVYWAVNQVRARRTVALEIQFIASDEFEGGKENTEFVTPSKGLFEHREAARSKEAGKSGAGALESLAAYVKDINQWPLLDFAQEQFLFRKMNYLKFMAEQARAGLNLDSPSAAAIRRVEQYLRRAEAVKQQLIQSNLRLVVSVARKHTRNESQMIDLIGDGNMALMNAVAKFDYSRRTKFSTYATWALIKRFATSKALQEREQATVVENEWLDVANDMRVEEGRVEAIETARQSLDSVMDQMLDQRERLVVREHYGLGDDGEPAGQKEVRRRAKSFKAIGEMLDLSKERVRQIELMALQKLRKVLTGEQFDYLMSS